MNFERCTAETSDIRHQPSDITHRKEQSPTAAVALFFGKPVPAFRTYIEKT
jgi:hypothetical protein